MTATTTTAAAAAAEAATLLRSTRDALRQPVGSAPALLALLCPPLDLLSLLPPALANSSSTGADALRWPGSRSSEVRAALLGRSLGSLQAAVLELARSWWVDGGDDDDDALVRLALRTWFCPAWPEDSRTASLSATALAVSGLQVLLSPAPAATAAASTSSSSDLTPPAAPLSFTLPLLANLVVRYPVRQVYTSFATSASASSSVDAGPWPARETVGWEAYARALASVPAKAANLAQGGRAHALPPALEEAQVFGAVVRGVDALMWEHRETGLDRRPLAFLVGLLLRQGFASPSAIPPSLPTALASPTTLFAALLPRFLPRFAPPSLADPGQNAYAQGWKNVLTSAARSLADRARLAGALVRHLLLGFASSPSTAAETAAACARAGQVLHALVPTADEPQLAEKVLLGVEAVGLAGGEREIDARARAGVWWVGGGRQDGEALAAFMMRVLDLWTDLQFIKFSLVAKHTYVLTLLLLLLRSFPPQSAPLQRVASSPAFLNGLTHYLSHPDRTVRHLGMLGAEVVSELTVHAGGKPLDFGLWAGEEPFKALARRLRAVRMDWAPVAEGADLALGWRADVQPSEAADPLATAFEARGSSSKSPPRPPAKKPAKAKKARALVVLSDSDDSLTGYQSSSSVSSSRSASPSPSDLDEFVDDPTLYNAKKKKVPRPVYLAQLGELLGSRDDPDKLEAGLKWGEALVRRKRGFGLELEENAVYVALMLAGLNDNFELDDFDSRKQGILNALVSCAPSKAAPALIEQYFHNQYSLQQRSAILTALAMGAREAAGLPTLAAPATASVDWPSKRLPPALHQRYVSPSDANPRLALAGGGGAQPASTRGQVEHVAGELSSLAIERSRAQAEAQITEFQKEQSVRVKRFSRRPPSSAAAAAVLSAEALGIEAYKDVAAECFILPLINRFWLHHAEEDAKAARATSRYSATGAGMVLSALALCKLLATMAVLVHAARHSALFLAVIAPEALRLAVTTAGRAAAARHASSVDDGEVSVLAAALELAVVCLDASRDLDGGRTLVVDHAGVVLAVAEWAALVFDQTERGERVLGEGGEDEGRVRRNSAGLCVLVAEVREKWAQLASYG